MTNEELTQQVEKLTQELEAFKSLYYKDNYSDLQVFRKQVLFKRNVGFYQTTPIAQQPAITLPSGGTTIDSQSRTAINSLITTLKNLGLTL